VGIRITETDEEGRKGHEALLLMRSLQDLFLFDMAGREAAIASADVKSVADLVTNIFGMEADADPGPASGTLQCPACGESLTTGQKFCPACGMDMIVGQQGTAVESRPPERAPVSPPRIPSPERRDDSPAMTQGAATKDEKDGSATVATRPKFCKQCGGALNATDKFCKSCGHKVSA
jgi:RNA polymerase subunit RPABC4/transcription elongation factor Spt4